MATSETSSDKKRVSAGAFDIRTFIALLIGIYGVVLVIMGLVGTTEEELAAADGMNVNLWAGIGMVVAAAAFQTWAMVRPVVLPPDFETPSEDHEAEYRDPQ